jgi:drug/metabolite transporter (DMT)-like permease
MNFQGEIAALLTAFCWAFNSIVFAQAGLRVGSGTVNHLRLWIAFSALSIIHLARFNTPFPFTIEGDRLFYLAVSGLIGLIIGDGLLFEAFVLIGARLSMLLMLLAPIFGALLAWLVLGETLQIIEILAILVTVGGIGWVVSEVKGPSRERLPKYGLGILLGIGAAAGQAGGLLLSKIGMAGGYSAISASLVRIAAAAVVMGFIFWLRGKMPSERQKLKDRRAFLAILSGSLVGPVLGIILSLVAITHTHIGVASTLMSLSPVILIPVSGIIFKERVSLRAVLGTIIALIGAALLFFT